MDLNCSAGFCPVKDIKKVRNGIFVLVILLFLVFQGGWAANSIVDDGALIFQSEEGYIQQR